MVGATSAVVLCRPGKQVHDACIRCCTGSEYNHTAIVIWCEGELQLLEATAYGVGVCPLEFYINSLHWARG